MAHYAFLDENLTVTLVIVGKNEDEDGIDWEHLHKLKAPKDFYHAHQNNYHSFSPERKGDVSYTPKICRKKTFKEHTAPPINLIPIKDTNLVMEVTSL